jgi:hypothetical protein
MYFQKNIGLLDRTLRFSIALFLFGYAYWKGSYIALFAAIFVLFEALKGWCILYQILGKNSCPIGKK